MLGEPLAEESGSIFERTEEVWYIDGEECAERVQFSYIMTRYPSGKRMFVNYTVRFTDTEPDYGGAHLRFACPEYDTRRR